jgi:hypothetical protein
VSQLERVLLRLDTDLRQLRVAWAVVGGFAVSIRARPRTTFDVDVAIAVATDREAEAIVRGLTRLGYVLERSLEHEPTGRLAGVRLVPPSELGASASVDLLFASSGIEDEVVGAAERLEAIRGAVLPVARVGHLIALKVLADQPDRPQDRADALALLAVASPDERQLARAALDRIERRGYHRGKDLMQELCNLLHQAGAGDSRANR